MTKYICSECGYEAQKWFGVCPKCHEAGTSQEQDSKSILTKNLNDSASKYKASVLVKRISENVDKTEDPKVIHNIPMKNLNQIFSTEGGLLEGQIVLLAAAPGVGKSTLMTQISTNNTLYISTEETEKQVTNRFKRCNPETDCYVFSTVSEEEVYATIEDTECNFIVLDSLNSIENGSLSYVKYAQIAQKICNLVKSKGKSIIIISQVSKNNNIIGMESISHAVDTVCHMERSSISENIIFTSSKNRFAEAGNICLFRHRECGLEEIEEQITSGNLIGTTQFQMVAGSKKIPMEIQCLITDSFDESKATRRAIGINFNKIFVIEAIIRNNDPGFKTKYKDIFLSTSNGLLLPEGNDLAIVNSMLSAFYNKCVNLDYDSFKGMLNLNGTISGNKRFNNIGDLIALYKK